MSDIWAEFTPRQPAAASADPWAEFTPAAPRRENTVTVRPAGRMVAMPAYDTSGAPTGMQEDVAVDVASPSRTREQLDDIVKSAGGGLVRGVAGLAGMPEAAAEMLVTGVDRLQQKLTGETEQEYERRIADRKANVMFPGAAEAISPKGIQRSIETATGPAYVPQTTAGQFASTAAEFAPGGMIGRLPNIVGNTITYGVIPGLASEAGGQAFKGSAMETPARVAFGLAGGIGASAARRAGSADRLLQQATEGVTRAELDAAERLMQEAQRMGAPLTRAEAVQSVTNGRTGLGDLQHTVEGLGGLRDFHAVRPAQTEAAGRRAFDAVSPRVADPSQVGPQVGTAAEGIVNRVRDAINIHTRPMYQAGASNLVPDSVHAAMIADPLFDQALRTVRNDPARNSFIRGQSDRSIATYDAVKKELEERARAASQPTNPNASQAVSSATGTLGNDVRDIAIVADRAATHGPSSYEAALAAQTRLREQYLNPLLNGPIGKVAQRDITTKKAINTLFPENPLPNSAGEISDAMRALSARSPRTARELVRTYTEGVFNETTQRLAGGPNQAGGARFAATLRGNADQAANLEAAVRALPDGDNVWQGLNRFLDVMESQQYRQATGSRTAFKGPAVKEMGNGGLVQSGLEVVSSGGYNFPAKIRDAFQSWSVGRNLDQLSNLLANPEAAVRFRNLVEAPRGSEKARLYAIRLANIALNSSSNDDWRVTVRPANAQR